MLAINMFNKAAAQAVYASTNNFIHVTLGSSDLREAARGMIFTQTGWGDGFNPISGNLDPTAEGNTCLNRYCYGKCGYNEFGNTPTATLYYTS